MPYEPEQSGARGISVNDLDRLINALTINQTERYELDIIHLVEKLLPNEFDGQPKDKSQFIKKGKTLQSRGTTPALQTLIFNEIKKKLKGPALVCIPVGATNLQDIINAIEGTIKINTVVEIQQKLLSLKAANMTVDRFKERLLSLLEELERSYRAMGSTQEITKTNLMEQTVAILKMQSNNQAMYALLRTEQDRATSPNQLIEFYFSESTIRETSHPIMSFRRNDNRYGHKTQHNYINRQNYNNNRHNNTRYNNNRFTNNRSNNNYRNNLGYSNTFRHNDMYRSQNNYNQRNGRNNNYPFHDRQNQNSNQGRGHDR